MKKIILASASPRRKELLEQIGLRFEVDPSNCSEDIDPELSPHELARALSLRKANAAGKKYRDAVVIAADTFIVLGDRIMGKPHTSNEAGKMLRAISGKAHSVITGFTIMDTEEKKTVTESVETVVYIRELSAEEIDVYVKSGEPLGKAGAYAIQGLGAALVERIDGDYSNVVGLPLNALAQRLQEFGIHVL